MRFSPLRHLRFTSSSVALLFALGLTTACGGHHSTSTQSALLTSTQVSTAAPARTSSEPKTPLSSEATVTQPSATALGRPVNSQRFALRSDNGYKATVKIAVYHVVHADAIPSLPFTGRNTITSCEINSETDGVIPVGVTITNTTKSFSEALSLDVAYGLQRSTSLNLKLDSDTSCGDPLRGQTITRFSLNSPLTSGESGTLDFFILYPNYWTPSAPAGQPKELRRTCLGFMLSHDQGTTQFNDSSPDAAMSLGTQSLCSV